MCIRDRDSVLTVPYTEDEILRIENFAEELATEKITGQLYTMGVPYEDARIKSKMCIRDSQNPVWRSNRAFRTLPVVLRETWL